MGQLVNDGIAAMKAGDFYRAIYKLEQASKLQPTNKFVRQHLGFAYCQCGTKELSTFNFADATLYFTKGIPLLDK